MNVWVRRAAGAFALAALLAGDSAVTWQAAARRFNRAVSAPVYREAGEDPMERFRLEREQLRAREEAQLNDVIHSDGSDAELVARAEAQLLDMLSRMEEETDIEGVLQSRGFEGALASVSRGSASILVRRDALTRQETAVILDLVMRETGLTGGNVKIIPVK